MKKLAFLLVVAATSAFANDVYVPPHVTKNGTYVQGHHRSSPDSNPYNNYSTQGNYNPYTGQAGTVDPYKQQYQQPSSNRGSSNLCVKDLYGNCM